MMKSVIGFSLRIFKGLLGKMKRYLTLSAFISAIIILISQFSCDTHDVYVNSLGMTMTRIPAGSFFMGDTCGHWDEIPVHNVTISKAFYISKTEITIEQFKMFKENYHGYETYSPYATGISWYNANEFCKWLSLKENKNFRLPTEAEWEYVCQNRETWKLKKHARHYPGMVSGLVWPIPA